MNKTNVFYFVVIFFVGIFSYTLFTNSITINLETGSLNKLKFFSTVSPQGWGFFTKSPREDQVSIYEIDQDNKVINKMLPNSHFKNYFGLSKKCRMIGYELSIILAQLKHEKWEKFNGNFIANKDKIKIDNSNLQFLKEGKFAIVKENIVPYLWRNLTKPNKEIIYVECTNP